MKARLLILTLLAGAWTGAHACSCIATSFCESSANAHFVALVEKKADIGENGIEARVLEVLHGRFSGQEVRIWGDLSGLTCGPYVGYHDTGQQLVVALFKVTTHNEPGAPAVPGDFFLPICSLSVLPVHDGKVEGYITSTRETESMSLGRFRRILPDCLFPKLLFEATEEGLLVRTLYEVTSDQWELTVRDLRGRELQHWVARKEEDQILLSAAGYPRGMYVLQVQINGRQKTFKGILGN